MGHVPALTMYGLAMVDEWTARGGEDTTRDKIMEFAPQAAHPDYAAKIPMPPWLGNADFHLSHRSRLVAKDPRFYTGVVPGHGSGPGLRLARAPASSCCRRILPGTACGSCACRSATPILSS